MSKFNKETLAALQTAVKHVVQADNTRLKGEESVLAKTQEIITVAVTIGSLKAWDAHRAELDRLARIAKKSTLRQLGYEETEVERKGTKTLVRNPRQTLKNIFSTVRQSFVHAVELTDKKGAPRTYGAIMSDKNKASRKAKLAKATPRDKDLAQLADIFKAAQTNAKALSDADLNAIVARLAVEMPATFPAASKKAA